MMRRGTLLTVILLGIFVILRPSGALATTGSYEVSACNYAPEAVNNSWIWESTDPSQPDHYAEHANCPYRIGGTGGKTDQEGGLSTTDALGLSNGAPPGTSAGWTFTAPAGTTITGLTYERYIGHESDPKNSWSPALRADGTIVPGETCLDTVQNGESCFVGGPPGEGGAPSVITGLSAHQLSLGIVCQAPTGEECVTGARLHEVWAAMYGARVTLSDPIPPTLDTPSGALWEPSETGFHKGTQSVTISAEDIGGGIQSIDLAADGHTIQTYDASCNFTYAQPCPSSTGAQTLTLPTTELADGTHTLTLVATDAAGNQSPIASEQITVDNNPPPAPVGLTATATQVGGSTFTATWADPSGQVAPITTATYQVCPASGSGACSVPTAAPAAGPTTVTVPGPGSWSLAVWLTNAAGNSSSANAAHITLTVPVVSSGGGSSGDTGSGSSDSGNPGSTGSSPAGKGSSATKTTLHLSETLCGRELVVRVSGPVTGMVRVSYAGRYRGRVIALATKRVTLRHGRLTATFRLSARAARYATIRVDARLNNGAPVSNTLRRPHRAIASSCRETSAR